MDAYELPYPTLARAVGSGVRLEGAFRAVVDLDVLCAEPEAPADRFAADYLRLLIAASAPVVATVHLDEARPRHRRAAARLSLARWPVRCERLLAGLDARGARVLAAHLWPAGFALRRAGAVGCLGPALLCVGEREVVPRNLPFRTRSGAWLLAALRRRGHDPLAVALANAFTADDAPNPGLPAALAAVAALPRPPAILALGERAAEALEALGVRCVYAPHPAWHRRFRHEEGPAGYAARLAAAGAPAGPYLAGGRVAEPPGAPEHWQMRLLGPGWCPPAYLRLAEGDAALTAP